MPNTGKEEQMVTLNFVLIDLLYERNPQPSPNNSTRLSHLPNTLTPALGNAVDTLSNELLHEALVVLLTIDDQAGDLGAGAQPHVLADCSKKLESDADFSADFGQKKGGFDSETLVRDDARSVSQPPLTRLRRSGTRVSHWGRACKLARMSCRKKRRVVAGSSWFLIDSDQKLRNTPAGLTNAFGLFNGSRELNLALLKVISHSVLLLCLPLKLLKHPPLLLDCPINLHNP
ncbi:hypothetical protein KC363_g228 [Hortaea werneckii]|nr:hypothetical protein KC363_g228 [Hortaea werneckii]